MSRRHLCNKSKVACFVIVGPGDIPEASKREKELKRRRVTEKYRIRLKCPLFL
jgi:hypothetical protein